MKLASTSLLGIAFALIFVLSGEAESTEPPVEKSLVVESAWVVADHEFLKNWTWNFTGDLEGRDMNFPEEIPTNAAWAGATLTDGNEIWTVITLHLGENNTNSQRSIFAEHIFGEFRLPAVSDFMLKTKLQNNAVIAAAFPDGEFQMDRRDSWLWLISPGLSERDDTVRYVQSLWRNLRRKSHFGFIQFYPERTLLPVLPPEQEDESAFIKRVRGRASNYYKDGQFVGQYASTFVGLWGEGNELRIIFEQAGIEGVEVSADTETLPFPFSGFVNPDAPVGAAFRVPDWVERGNIIMRGGFQLVPLEEREEGKEGINFTLGIAVQSDEVAEGDGYHLISDGSMHVLYPRQPENRPEEDDRISNAELDEINEKLARGLFVIWNEIQALDWSQPVDIAFSFEDGVGYLACSHPSDMAEFDLSVLTQFDQVALDSLRAIASNDAELLALENFSLEYVFGSRVEKLGEPEMIAGVMCRQITFLFTRSEGSEHRIFAIVGHEPERVYAAIIFITDEIAEEQKETMKRQLAQKINDSKQGIAEKLKPPVAFLNSRVEGTNFRVNYETIGTGFRFTVHVANDSFGNVLGLAKNFGGDYLKQALPFMRMFE